MSGADGDMDSHWTPTAPARHAAPMVGHCVARPWILLLPHPSAPVFFDVLDSGNRIAFSRRLPRVDFKTEVNRFLGYSQCG